IGLQLPQILALAPSIRWPMLPVVSRQNPTSTFGRSFFAALPLGAAPEAGTLDNTNAATAANTTRAPMIRSSAALIGTPPQPTRRPRAAGSLIPARLGGGGGMRGRREGETKKSRRSYLR